MNLEPLHEKAIDLFVAGKKQHEVAQELNVNPRTVRRWAEEDKFVAELNKHHALARKLQQDEAAEIARENRELRKLGRNRIRAILEDPNASDYLVIQTLKLLQHEERLERRAEEAQAWREFVFQDKKAERQEQANRDREEYEKRINAMKQTSPAEVMLNMMKAQEEAAVAKIRADIAAEKAAKADKSGHGRTPPVLTPPKADKTGHGQTVPSVQPVQPFRYPRPEKKADKSGQPAVPDLASIIGKPIVSSALNG